MLERVYVDNFRCLVNFECRFGERALIQGANGSGKTCLLDALRILRDYCGNGMHHDGMFLGCTRTRWQQVSTQTFELDVSGNGGSYSFRLTMDEWGRPVARPRIVKEEVLFCGKPIFRFANGEVQLYNDQFEPKVQYPFDPHRSALATVTERQESSFLTWFKRWLANLTFVSPDPRRMQPVAVRESPWLDQDLSNFASWYRYVCQEHDDHELLVDLKEVLHGFQTMRLKDAGMGNRILVVTYEGQDDQHLQYTFNELSDGQRLLIALYAMMHFVVANGVTLFLDEPDNFVALTEIQPLLERLFDRVEETGAQVILVSHHPEVLNRMAYGNGLWFDRPQGLHTRVQPFKDSDATGLSPAELVARGWTR